MSTDNDNNLTKLVNTIKETLGNLITLEIITAVGQIKFDANSGPDLDYEKDPSVILTKINLVQGDIKTVYDPEFVTGNYKDLKTFHQAREEQGHKMIMDNLEALKGLLGLAMQLNKDKQ